MVLFVIGLGLGDEKDITVRGLEVRRVMWDIDSHHTILHLRDSLPVSLGRAQIKQDLFGGLHL